MLDRKNEYVIYAAVLLLALIPLFFLGLSNHGLWTADEPRVAEIGREMAVTGNWAVPMLNQRPFLEEPPLYYVALAAVFKAAGHASDKIVRIPSALFGLGGVIALFFLGNMLFGPRVGFISGIILATCGEYFRVAHWVIVDSALAFFIISAMTLFVAGYLSENKGRKLLWYVLCYACCGFAFFSKGFIGIAIPGLAVLVFLIFDRNLRELLRMHLWLAILIFAAMTLPWFLSLWTQGGSEYLKVFLVYNHFQRFVPGGWSGHHQPFYYYLTQFPAAFLPWSLLLLPVLLWGFGQSSGFSARPAKGTLLAKCWFFTGFVFLSVASTKRVLYLMPVFAPMALLTAAYIDSTLTRTTFRKLEKPFLWAFGLAPFATGLVLLPSFLFLSKTFHIGFPLKETVWVSAGSVVATALSCMGLRSLWQRNAAKFWCFSAASVFSLMLLGLVAVVPLLDHFKSFVPFCGEITATVPAGSTLYGYRPDETLRGVVPFYTGHYMEEVENLAAMEEILNRADSVFVVARDSRGQLEKELLSTERLMLLHRQDISKDRGLLLLSNRPRVSSKPAAAFTPAGGGAEGP